MATKGKSVKEIADELGVSKQAIFKKIKREPLSTSLQGLTETVDGRLTVSVDGEKLIKQAFSRVEPSTDHQPVDGGCRQPVDGRLTVAVDGEKLIKQAFSRVEPSTHRQPVDGGCRQPVDGRLTVAVDGEKLIKQAFSRVEPSTHRQPVDGGCRQPVDGRLTVAVDGENPGAEELFKSDHQKEPPKGRQKDETFLAVLEATIDTLKGQLEAKDKQIEMKDSQIEEMQQQAARLHEELAEERRHSREQAEKLAVLADQAQRLQLAQMHPELTAGGEAEAQDEPEAPPEPIGLFQRLFRRK